MTEWYETQSPEPGSAIPTPAHRPAAPLDPTPPASAPPLWSTSGPWDIRHAIVGVTVLAVLLWALVSVAAWRDGTSATPLAETGGVDAPVLPAAAGAGADAGGSPDDRAPATSPAAVLPPVSVPDRSSPTTAPADEPSDRGGSGTGWARLAQRYQGVATVTMEIYDFCNARFERQLVDTVRFEVPVDLLFSEPSNDGSSVESNGRGMNLVLGSLDALETWSVFLQSALVVTTPETSRQLLQQYWDIDVADGRLGGRLVDTHGSEATAINALSESELLIPCRPGSGTIASYRPLAVGSTLDGVMSAEAASLVLEAESVDSLRRIRVEMSANAVSR